MDYSLWLTVLWIYSCTNVILPYLEFSLGWQDIKSHARAADQILVYTAVSLDNKNISAAIEILPSLRHQILKIHYNNQSCSSQILSYALKVNNQVHSTLALYIGGKLKPNNLLKKKKKKKTKKKKNLTILFGIHHTHQLAQKCDTDMLY